MTIPVELIVAIFVMLVSYFVWNFRVINKIFKQQLINSVRLHNIEKTIGLENPFSEERMTNE